MCLKKKIYDEILALNKDNISIISMRLYYIISEKLLEINTNVKYKHLENKIYNVSSICADNIECLLNSIIKENGIEIDSEKLSNIIYKFVITNIKYI